MASTARRIAAMSAPRSVSVRSGPPEEFGRYIAGQVGNWRRIIARNKIEFD